MEQDKEQFLIKQVKEGDRHAFGLLIQMTEQVLYLFCFRLNQDADNSKELMQKTYLQALKNIRNFNNNARFSTWLVRICINIWLNDRKHNRLWKIEPLEKEKELIEGGAVYYVDRNDSEKSMMEKISKKNIHDKLWSILGRLHPKEKLLLTLRDVEGKTYEEICEIFNCSQGTVASRLARARKKLKRQIEPFLE